MCFEVTWLRFHGVDFWTWLVVWRWVCLCFCWRVWVWWSGCGDWFDVSSLLFFFFDIKSRWWIHSINIIFRWGGSSIWRRRPSLFRFFAAICIASLLRTFTISVRPLGGSDPSIWKEILLTLIRGLSICSRRARDGPWSILYRFWNLNGLLGLELSVCSRNRLLRLSNWREHLLF